jgi:hypothetical protein
MLFSIFAARMTRSFNIIDTSCLIIKRQSHEADTQLV